MTAHAIGGVVAVTVHGAVCARVFANVVSDLSRKNQARFLSATS